MRIFYSIFYRYMCEFEMQVHAPPFYKDSELLVVEDCVFDHEKFKWKNLLVEHILQLEHNV